VRSVRRPSLGLVTRSERRVDSEQSTCPRTSLSLTAHERIALVRGNAHRHCASSHFSVTFRYWSTSPSISRQWGQIERDHLSNRRPSELDSEYNSRTRALTLASLLTKFQACKDCKGFGSLLDCDVVQMAEPEIKQTRRVIRPRDVPDKVWCGDVINRASRAGNKPAHKAFPETGARSNSRQPCRRRT
jgi:hypothetical protein